MVITGKTSDFSCQCLDHWATSPHNKWCCCVANSYTQKLFLGAQVNLLNNNVTRLHSYRLTFTLRSADVYKKHHNTVLLLSGVSIGSPLTCSDSIMYEWMDKSMKSSWKVEKTKTMGSDNRNSAVNVNQVSIIQW